MNFRIIITLLILIPSAAYSQRTANSSETEPLKWRPLEIINAEIETDEIDVINNNSRVRITKMWSNFSDKSIIGLAKRIDDSFGFQFFVSGIGCFSEISSKIEVKLANREVVELAQISKNNCESVAGAAFIPLSRDDLDNPDKDELIIENLNKLISHNWIEMRIYGSRGQLDIEPKERKKYNGALFFREHLQALGYNPQ